MLRKPYFENAGRHWKNGRLRTPQQQLQNEQRREQAGAREQERRQWRRHGGQKALVPTMTNVRRAPWRCPNIPPGI